jgi:membrane associated rhomboid family serine protease
MSFGNAGFPRLTPWVGKLIAATAVVQLLLETVFTSPEFAGRLVMMPEGFAAQPWGAVTYLFIHSGILHLATNMFALYMFGSAVEDRMGSRTFILYYLYCGIGAALASLLLAQFTTLLPIQGASGAVLGVAVAFAIYWPDAEVTIFPFPIAIRARTLVILLALIDLVFAKLGSSGVAHEAHLGGMLAGYLFFKIPTLTRRRPVPTLRQQPERVVLVQQSSTREDGPRATAPSRMPPRSGPDPVAAEVDRVLDKISAKGIQSLTLEERRFLDEVSKRKQREIH